jgi:hypothetical protein
VLATAASFDVPLPPTPPLPGPPPVPPPEEPLPHPIVANKMKPMKPDGTLHAEIISFLLEKSKLSHPECKF